MKLIWDEEEYYPVFQLTESDGGWPSHEVDMSPEFFDRYKAAMKEFWDVQREIREMVLK